MARLPHAGGFHEGYKSRSALSEYLEGSGLGEALLDLVYLRVSQVNGCEYCVDALRRNLLRLGEDGRRLDALPAWRESPLFTSRERAALTWVESITRLRDQRMSVKVFLDVLVQFTDEELVHLVFAVARINSINNMAIGLWQTPWARKRPGASEAA